MTVTPLGRAPVFKIVAKHRAREAHLPHAFLSEHTVGWTGHYCMRFWDFRRDIHSTVKMEEFDGLLHQVTHIDNNIYLLDSHSLRLHVFPFPDLVKHSDVDQSGVEFSMLHPTSVQRHNLPLLVVMSDYLAEFLPLEEVDSPFLHFIGFTTSSTRNFYRFLPQLPQTSNSEEGRLPHLMGSCSLLAVDSEHVSEPRISSLFCKDEVLFVWFDYAKGICVSLPRIAGEAFDVNKSHMRLWIDHRDYESMTWYDWSPLLGRICLLKSDNEIRVLDFVPPPPN
ncbi:hypothetical protein JAAARDRAFT_81965 [Jaapia argillacea MUCL 33604]|uniref:Uncharacterized protein n=1 Tax=Jaapia argillacea MUCL 33604 TaxID=933084 RepID=A0A067P601_9AGAM|nr:hypothetical protein JAAARDRAFT_81965 [Jaapia argillacea MUCL 33604]